MTSRRTTGATPAAAPAAARERAPVIPIHPFTGLLSVAQERGWSIRDIFRGFDFDERGAPVPGQYINFLTAREILLRARHAGGPELSAQSGSRKALPNLGVIGLGVMSQPGLGEAIRFGLEFQRLAGSMLDVQLRIEGDEASIVAHDLYADDETRSFLHVDHLLTAINTLALLPSRGFAVKRLELQGELPADVAERLAREWGCEVRMHEAESRVVFSASLLHEPLRFSDPVTAQLARQACEKEMTALGLDRAAPAVRDHLLSPDERLRTPRQLAGSLGVSTRTLHRMLAAEGVKYAQFAEGTRMEKARRLLAEGLGTEAVALALDYSDERSFRRAFERITGESPAVFRRRIGGAGR